LTLTAGNGLTRHCPKSAGRAGGSIQVVFITVTL